MKQTTSTILMVRPSNFAFNPETAANNTFQKSESDLSLDQIKVKAQAEFDRMVSGLRSLEIDVTVIEDTDNPVKTDAVFPNNWITTHEDGSVLLYPMFSPNRRLERRDDIVDILSERFEVSEVDDTLLQFEDGELYLEGTGSMILDRPNKIVYACRSVRTDDQVIHAFADKKGYQVVMWDSVDLKRVPVYHTNVIMTLGQNLAVICTESIVNENERKYVIESLSDSGKEVVDISQNQVLQFAGNMLEVQDNEGRSYMIMSQSAHNSLNISQINIIEKYNSIASFDINTIEYFGGGSARCMIAEIFLPMK